MSQIPDTSEGWKAKAAELRRAADRMDAVAVKMTEVEKEWDALAPWFAEPAPQEPRKLTQNETIIQIVRSGPKTVQEVFAEMQVAGCAPKDANQVSALLSKLKSAGTIDNRDGKWVSASRSPEAPVSATVPPSMDVRQIAENIQRIVRGTAPPITALPTQPPQQKTS